jgi:hypothetical protein
VLALVTPATGSRWGNVEGANREVSKWAFLCFQSVNIRA